MKLTLEFDMANEDEAQTFNRTLSTDNVYRALYDIRELINTGRNSKLKIKLDEIFNKYGVDLERDWLICHDNIRIFSEGVDS